MLVRMNSLQSPFHSQGGAYQPIPMFALDREAPESFLRKEYVQVSGKKELQERVIYLEEKLEGIQSQLDRLTRLNGNTQKDMRFFETMLLEEYHLLLQLLGKDQTIQIHQVE